MKKLLMVTAAVMMMSSSVFAASDVVKIGKNCFNRVDGHISNSSVDCPPELASSLVGVESNDSTDATSPRKIGDRRRYRKSLKKGFFR